MSLTTTMVDNSLFLSIASLNATNEYPAVGPFAGQTKS